MAACYETSGEDCTLCAMVTFSVITMALVCALLFLRFEQLVSAHHAKKVFLCINCHDDIGIEVLGGLLTSPSDDTRVPIVATGAFDGSGVPSFDNVREEAITFMNGTRIGVDSIMESVDACFIHEVVVNASDLHPSCIEYYTRVVDQACRHIAREDVPTVTIILPARCTSPLTPDAQLNACVAYLEALAVEYSAQCHIELMVPSEDGAFRFFEKKNAPSWNSPIDEEASPSDAKEKAV